MDVVLAKVFGEQVVREVREEGVVKVLKVDRPSGGFGKGHNMAEAIPVDGDRTSAVLWVGRPFLNKFFKKFPEGHPGVFHLPDDLALRLVQFQFEFFDGQVLPLTFVGQIDLLGVLRQLGKNGVDLGILGKQAVGPPESACFEGLSQHENHFIQSIR